MRGEGFDAVGEGFAGEIGTLGHPADEKAHVIDHQIAAACTGQAVPSDPCLAVLEMVGTGRPLDDGDRLAVLADDVDEAVPHWFEAAEEVLGLQPTGGGSFVIG